MSNFYDQFILTMKRLFLLIFLIITLVSCRKEPSRVFLFIEDSQQLSYMVTHEVGKMKEELNQSGFKITTSTLSGEALKTDSITLVPDIKLANVNIDDFAGFILPCMASDTVITSQEIEFVKKVVSKGKPIAAQVGAVQILARAGVLEGKKYAFVDEKNENHDMYPEFSGGNFCGNGVIRDGNIITSGTCPWMAKLTGHQDGTAELTHELINVMKGRIK